MLTAREALFMDLVKETDLSLREMISVLAKECGITKHRAFVIAEKAMRKTARA